MMADPAHADGPSADAGAGDPLLAKWRGARATMPVPAADGDQAIRCKLHMPAPVETDPAVLVVVAEQELRAAFRHDPLALVHIVREQADGHRRCFVAQSLNPAGEEDEGQGMGRGAEGHRRCRRPDRSRSRLTRSSCVIDARLPPEHSLAGRGQLQPVRRAIDELGATIQSSRDLMRRPKAGCVMRRFSAALEKFSVSARARRSASQAVSTMVHPFLRWWSIDRTG